MKTFSVRDLDRGPSSVLDECDHAGEVKIRRRDGRTYTIRADAAVQPMGKLPDFAARIEKIFPKPIPAAQSALVDKMIRGE